MLPWLRQNSMWARTMTVEAIHKHKLLCLGWGAFARDRVRVHWQRRRSTSARRVSTSTSIGYDEQNHPMSPSRRVHSQHWIGTLARGVRLVAPRRLPISSHAFSLRRATGLRARTGCGIAGRQKAFMEKLRPSLWTPRVDKHMKEAVVCRVISLWRPAHPPCTPPLIAAMLSDVEAVPASTVDTAHNSPVAMPRCAT